MSTHAHSIAISPLLFGEAFIAGAVAMQKRIADDMLAAFDAVADAMSDSLRANATLADDISRAETPADIVAAGHAWLQGRAQQGMSWLRVLGERLAARSVTPQPQAALPAPVRRAPVAPQAEIRMPTKPPAGKLRSAPIVVAKAAKKVARPAAK